MSIADDVYRKPNPGMYQTLLKMIPPVTSSFYSGDAAGRPQDFSDSDIMFATNTGMKFYTPEQLFLPVERIKPLPNIGLNDIPFPNNKNIVLFVGMPGSGKSRYFQTKLAGLGYIHVNQDILKTKAPEYNNIPQGSLEYNNIPQGSLEYNNMDQGLWDVIKNLFEIRSKEYLFKVLSA